MSSYAVDPDHHWLLSLSWQEEGKPYPDRPHHRPLFDYGLVRKFDSEGDAWDAKRRCEIDLSWAPKWARNDAVSEPLKVRRHPEEAKAMRERHGR